MLSTVLITVEKNEQQLVQKKQVGELYYYHKCKKETKHTYGKIMKKRKGILT